MENKLSITEIRYIRRLAAIKTDEELADMIGKPVGLVQMQFALMSDLPKRPWEKVPVIKTPKVPKAQKQPKSPKEKIRRSTSKSSKVDKPISIKHISRAERKLIREKKKADKEREKREKQSAHAIEMQHRKKRKEKLERETKATRTLDLSGTIPIKLNAKTIVWVKPGTNIDQLKKKYNIA